ncbi:MAG: hypothetical protein KC492_19570 [Myxococcales bacterium]|nr:hypothetical protein [Myxococcales bacterium]
MGIARHVGAVNTRFVFDPSRAAFDAFFADPAYLAVRERFFVPSVGAISALGEYTT